MYRIGIGRGERKGDIERVICALVILNGHLNKSFGIPESRILGLGTDKVVVAGERLVKAFEFHEKNGFLDPDLYLTLVKGENRVVVLENALVVAENLVDAGGLVYEVGIGRVALPHHREEEECLVIALEIL